QELNRRMNIKQDKIVDVKITTPEVVYDYYKNIVNEYQEYFYCLYLDSNKKVLSEKLLFMGTVNESMVHPRDVFKEAYLVNATAIICVHNHPTGDVRPSKEDIIVTDQLNEIGYLMGIKLVDHVIVSKNKYYSFLENGKI
ncbi:MAG: DNA repair protein RadC, partial [Bacilli bacterium]|nr:DNA repair protein RadC [Bacilli bacterium]